MKTLLLSILILGLQCGCRSLEKSEVKEIALNGSDGSQYFFFVTEHKNPEDRLVCAQKCAPSTDIGLADECTSLGANYLTALSQGPSTLSGEEWQEILGKLKRDALFTYSNTSPEQFSNLVSYAREKLVPELESQCSDYEADLSDVAMTQSNEISKDGVVGTPPLPDGAILEEASSSDDQAVDAQGLALLADSHTYSHSVNVYRQCTKRGRSIPAFVYIKFVKPETNTWTNTKRWRLDNTSNWSALKYDEWETVHGERVKLEKKIYTNHIKHSWLEDVYEEDRDPSNYYELNAPLYFSYSCGRLNISRGGSGNVHGRNSVVYRGTRYHYRSSHHSQAAAVAACRNTGLPWYAIDGHCYVSR